MTLLKRRSNRLFGKLIGKKPRVLNGYGSKFFKDSWDIIRTDLEEGVLEFFRSEKMLKAVNSTVITVILKSSHTEAVGDYRPIACCNTIYKIISKMLCSDLKSSCQAFSLITRVRLQLDEQSCKIY